MGSIIPPDVKLWHIVWSGHMDPSEEEIFAYGRYAYTLDTATPEDVAAEVQDDVTNMLGESTTGSPGGLTTLAQMFPTHVHWDQVKASQINKVDGTLVGEPATVSLSDVGAGTSDWGMPYQIAFAVTYEAGIPDRKRRNRFYLPPMIYAATDGHGRLRSALVDDIQTQIALNALAHQTGDLGLTWCIRAEGSLNGGWEIDRYHSGDVMDTIRRRRNKLPEVRHTHSPT